MSRRLDTRLCGPGPTSAGAGECVSTRYYIIPTPPSSHTDTDPDILYLRLLLPRAWVLSHTLTCCFWDHRPRPLPPGLSWWKLCVRFPSQECVHCGSWDRLYSRRHVYTCNLSWKIVWIIPGTTQMWVFSSNDQIDWNYANGTHVRDHSHMYPWHRIVNESWIKDLLPGCDCLSFQTRGDSPLWSGQWQFSKLALYCDKLGCTKCRAVAGAKLMLQLIPDHRIDRSNKKMLCFPAQKQITLPPPFVKSSWTANELLHSSRICTISV